ncbi:hypothetical protein N665_1046s0015, partial [Sinapis alba]
YLESRWCLDELAEIRNCLLRKQLDFVIPIFYKVKTSHVEKQTGDFGKPFPSLQKKHPHPHLRVLRWKKALKFVAKSIGLSYRENRWTPIPRICIKISSIFLGKDERYKLVPYLKHHLRYSKIN